MKTILIAEDNALLRYATAKTFRHHGYRVLEASDGVEALRLAEEEPTIHLLISDLDMPHVGGEMLVVKLKTSRPNMVVILTTGRSADDIPKNVCLHSNHVLAKPVDQGILIQCAQSLVGNR